MTKHCVDMINVTFFYTLVLVFYTFKLLATVAKQNLFFSINFYETLFKIVVIFCIKLYHNYNNLPQYFYFILCT